MKMVIKTPNQDLLDHIKKCCKLPIPPLEKNTKLDHVIIYLDSKYYYTYKSKPLTHEIFYILPITTIDQLNIVFVWHNLGMTFEEIKTCLGDEL